MDYLKLYNKLIESRKSVRNTKIEVGYELHHILPKCLGGTDKSSNLVKLTFREHFIAHWLLSKIYFNEPKMQYAFFCMTRDPLGNRKITSRMNSIAKKSLSKVLSINWTLNNPMHKEENRKKVSEMMKRNNPNKGGIYNHTAYPVEVVFDDGTSKIYSYMKEASDSLNIPYSSIKVARRNGTPMKKYKILSVRKLEG